jgi:cell shape-determining protein MreC
MRKIYILKKIVLTLIFTTPISSAFANAEANERLFTYSLTACQSIAALVSGYAVWLGDFTKLVNDDIKLHPENSAKDRRLLKEANEKSKDKLYEGFQEINLRFRASADIKGLTSDLQGLVSTQAEMLGSTEPGMSRTYYQRSLDGFCSEAAVSIYQNLRQ